MTTTAYRYRRVPLPPMGLREWVRAQIAWHRARRDGRRTVRRVRAQARKDRHAR